MQSKGYSVSTIEAGFQPYRSIADICSSAPLPAISGWAKPFSLIYSRPKTIQLFWCKRKWYRIELTHVVKIILSDVLGLRGAFSASPQAVLYHAAREGRLEI
jgi:hypothetical protein